MRIHAYVLAGDPDYLAASISSYYRAVDLNAHLRQVTARPGHRQAQLTLHILVTRRRREQQGAQLIERAATLPLPGAQISAIITDLRV